MMTERKKRTTIKEAHDVGFKDGRESMGNDFFEVIDLTIEDYERNMFENPRNTKFIEIEMDAIKDLKEKLIYKKHNKV